MKNKKQSYRHHSCNYIKLQAGNSAYAELLMLLKKKNSMLFLNMERENIPPSGRIQGGRKGHFFMGKYGIFPLYIYFNDFDKKVPLSSFLAISRSEDKSIIINNRKIQNYEQTINKSTFPC